MALFINAHLNSGNPALVNLAHVVVFHKGEKSITYTPSFGHVAGGYAPSIVSEIRSEWVDIIYAEICDFIATHENGVYDAHARIEELRNEYINSIQNK